MKRVPSGPRLRWSGLRGVVACVALAVASGQTPGLRVEGSDLLGEGVVAVLQARAAEMGQTVQANFKGSRPAQDRLVADVSDMAVVVEPLDAEPWSDEWGVVTLGYFTALIVAKHDLPVEQLSYADLAQIFGANSAVAANRWGDFGAPGGWSSVPIVGLVTSPDQGLAHVLVAHAVLNDGAFKGSIRRHETPAAALKALQEADGGLAIVPWIPAVETKAETKSLLVAATGDQVAFGPTPQNLHAGDYPLRAPVRLVFKRDRAPALLDWLRFWFSDEMAAALAEVGVVGLPMGARNQQVFALEVIH